MYKYLKGKMKSTLQNGLEEPEIVGRIAFVINPQCFSVVSCFVYPYPNFAKYTHTHFGIGWGSKHHKPCKPLAGVTPLQYLMQRCNSSFKSIALRFEWHCLVLQPNQMSNCGYAGHTQSPCCIHSPVMMLGLVPPQVEHMVLGFVHPRNPAMRCVVGHAKMQSCGWTWAFFGGYKHNALLRY